MIQMRNLFVIFLVLQIGMSGQTFYFGNDLSYANMMEDCGAVFKEKGQPKDVYQIFADHGTNLVRVRLWHNPTWQNSLSQPAGVKNQYNDYIDAKETIQRAKAAGMQVMLGLHFSDIWADQGRQVIPAAWSTIADNLTVLKDSVYNYVTYILNDLEKSNLMPEIVKIGNETNNGMMIYTSMDSEYRGIGGISGGWTRQAELFNSAIKAVRDVSATTTIKPKIALHFAGLTGLTSWYANVVSYGITDFDIIGFSYYYRWHGSSVAGLGSIVKTLKTSYPDKEIMPVETSYPWTSQNFDALGNIITDPDPQYSPLSPEMQLRYMVAYAKAVKANGGSGVVFWEPDWVSTPCRNPWGVGSGQENVAFFEVDSYNFMENGGGLWTEPQFYETDSNVIVNFTVNMTDADVSKGVYITGSFTGNPLEILPMYNTGNDIYTYTVSMTPGDTGAFYFLNDSVLSARETVPEECALMNGTDRKYTIGNTHTDIDCAWSSCFNIPIPDQVNVNFKVNMTGQDVSRGVYVTGDMNGWVIAKMTNEGNNVYSKSYNLKPFDHYAYYYLTTSTWADYKDYRETVPAECANSAVIMNDPGWVTDRAFIVPPYDTTINNVWESCASTVNIQLLKDEAKVNIYPVPTNGILELVFVENFHYCRLEICNLSGGKIKEKDISDHTNTVNIDLSDIPKGIYFLKIIDNNNYDILKKIVVN